MRSFIPKILSQGSIFILAALGAEFSKAGEPWIGWHYVGSQAIKTSTNAPTVNEIWRMPESQHLGKVLISRLSRMPDREILGPNITPPAIRPQIVKTLLEQLLTIESFGEIHGPASGPPTLSLAAKLSLQQVDGWDRHLRRYLGTLNWKEPQQNPSNDDLDWTAAHKNPALLARFTKQGDWLLLSVGPDAFSCLTEWKTALTDGKLPSVLPDGNVLRLKGNIDGLARWLANISLPSLADFNLNFKPQATGVRTEATIHLNEQIDFPLPEWSVPTNAIHDPVVSFSGARGLSGLVSSLPGTKTLAKQGIPPQFFSWSRTFAMSTNTAPIFPLYLGWPIPENDISIANLTKLLPAIVGSNIIMSRSARLISFPNRNETILQLLPPFIQPFVRGFTNATHGVRVAGLFPLPADPRPAPPTLFQQLNSAENLVYYQWEITQNRIDAYKTLLQLLSFMFDKPQMSTASASYRWLEAVAPKLGNNSVTIVTAPSPKELKLVRKSHFGLTGIEITALARWLEAKSFPWIDTELLSTWKMKPFLPPPTIPKPNAEIGR
ncbi:MAG: hypothetical protein M2R45_03013 [Verrucomicrobia subdivision 3 bacterium]|nr:hypothetical protein [Limisphaerales bacterium]MCS1416501.1 hypothetical protein [Limisphaerales bacterium]